MVLAQLQTASNAGIMLESWKKKTKKRLKGLNKMHKKRDAILSVFIVVSI